MFRNLFRGSQRAITTLTRPSASRQTPMFCREALIRQPRQSQSPYAVFRLFAGSRPYSSQSKLTVNSGTDVNGGNKANNKSDNTTKRGIICRAAAKAERQKHLALIYRVPERAGRENQLAHVHRVPPRSYRKHQLVLRTTSQMIQMEHNARVIIKALREISAKLDTINSNLDKIITNLEEIQKLDRYMFWTLTLAIIVMAVVGAILDPKRPNKPERETAGEVPPDASTGINDRSRCGLVNNA